VIFPGRPTPERLLEHIRAFKPTLLTSVPTAINQMSRHPEVQPEDLESLRMILSAGEALPEALFTRWMARFGVEILDGIGSAEMFHIYVSNRPGEARGGSLGRVVPGYEVRLVDEGGQPVEVGEVGRLHVKGGSTGLMYWQRRAESVATFRGDECVSADTFRQDEAGFFYYEGRVSDLLKVGGIFVSPLEVENCLLGHPAVEDVAVLGFTDEDGLIKAQAWVVLKTAFEPSDGLVSGLQTFAKERLAYFKTPRRVRFVTEPLPRNDRGKLDRKVIGGWR